MLVIRNITKLRGCYSKQTPQLSRLICSSKITQSNEETKVISPSINTSTTETINTINTISSTTIPTNTPEVIIEKLPELGYYPSDLICKALDGFHVLTGLPYWQSIVLGTVLIRVCLLPSAIISQKMTSRITYVKSEIDKINKLAELNPHKKLIYDQEISFLYKKHKVNPFGGFINPLIQLPVFLSVFFGLRKMGTYFPEFSNGGISWFSDLAVSDPMYILPIVNAVTLLGVTELGIRNIDMDNAPWFKPVVRGMAFLAVPLTMYLPSGLLVFWCVNNTWSVAQALVLRNPSVMNYFDILPPPVRPPPLKITTNSFKKIFNALTNNKPETIEYIDGNTRRTVGNPTIYNPQKKREAAAAAAASSTTSSSSTASSATTTTTVVNNVAQTKPTIDEPPPKTFTHPPKKKSKQRL